jgi:hypothetical protein
VLPPNLNSVKYAIIASMSEVIRTTQIKIDLPFETAKNTVMTWTSACNTVSRIAFSNGKRQQRGEIAAAWL